MASAKSSSGLRIARELALPLDIAGKKLAFLGTTGSGKTYAAMKLAEELLDAGIQTVALDPVGVWWGLRVAKDGKARGYPIVVFGGLHGDIPIEAGAGALVADIIVDGNISAVIDISQMDSDAEQGRFAAAFAARLFHRRKAQPAATMLFLEECQEFIPENPGRSETLKLHSFTRIVKIGRNFGIGVILISQRPQEVSKKALNLSECVFAFQMNGSQEREAMRRWLKDAGADKDVDVDILPTLDIGIAHLWSPRWLKVSRTVHILAKDTFDASGTPDHQLSAAVVAKPLQPADIEKITAAMAETIEKAKAEDPAELRRQVAALKTQLAKKLPPAAAAARAEKIVEKRVEVFVVKDPQIARLEKAAEKLVTVGNGLLAAIGKAKAQSAYEKETQRQALQRPVILPVARPAPVPRREPSAGSNGKLGAGERKILAAIVQHGQVTRPQLTVLTGYKRSSRDTYLQRLSAQGLIDPASLQPTDAGVAELGDFEPLPTGDELMQYWLRELSGGEKAILEILDAAHGAPVSRDHLTEVTGYQRSSRDTYIQRLSARQLVIAIKSGVRAAEELFG